MTCLELAHSEGEQLPHFGWPLLEGGDHRLVLALPLVCLHHLAHLYHVRIISVALVRYGGVRRFGVALWDKTCPDRSGDNVKLVIMLYLPFVKLHVWVRPYNSASQRIESKENPSLSHSTRSCRVRLCRSHS